MSRTPSLFPNDDQFVNRAVRAVTFQGKLDLPVHRWYRLTPSFSPSLADDISRHFAVGPGDMVLDPFSGVGTVPLCMKYKGVPACSVELNPYLHFVSAVKTRTYTSPGRIKGAFAAFVAEYRAAVATLPQDCEAGDYLARNQSDIPAISNPCRWWSPGNLMRLVCLRKLVSRRGGDPEVLNLLKMGILAVLIPLSNAKHNHVSLTFADNPLPTQDVAAVLQAKLDEIATDLAAVAPLPCAEVRVFAGNSKNLRGVMPPDLRPTVVITSPPYPNRFSYARETRPHLFFFDFIADAGAVGELETAAIGGTWGKATSVLASGVTSNNDLLIDLLRPYLRGLTPGQGLMESYVRKYFNDLFEHAGEVAAVCTDRCRLAYVIGNSKFYDNPLPSDEILAAVFSHFGFQLDGISKMRKRQSKTGLYESVVFMSR